MLVPQEQDLVLPFDLETARSLSHPLFLPLAAHYHRHP